jgi:hypothetical protein
MAFGEYQDIIRAQIKSQQDGGKDLGYSPENFVWVESNPQPLRNDHYVQETKDWRTEHRLSMFNDFSNTLFRHHNYTVIDTFSSLLPLYESGCDSAHYTASGMLYPIFQQVLSFLHNKK